MFSIVQSPYHFLVFRFDIDNALLLCRVLVQTHGSPHAVTGVEGDVDEETRVGRVTLESALAHVLGGVECAHDDTRGPPITSFLRENQRKHFKRTNPELVHH